MKQKSVSAAIEVRTIWHNIHPSCNAWSSSVPLSHHNFTDYPEQNNPETVLKISLHRACEDLHTQPLLPNGAVFQLFRWKISYCGSLWGKCPTCLLLLLMVVVLLYDLLSAVTGLLLIFLWPMLLVVVVIVVPLYMLFCCDYTCPWPKLLIV